MKNLTILFFLITLHSCAGRQEKTVATKPASTDALTSNRLTETDNGIVYFSRDNGRTWQNNSEGLPEIVSIGLGGLAASSTSVGVVTKENGIYFFDFQKNSWINVPTETQLIDSNPDELLFYKDQLYVGTQHGGVFVSTDQGVSWSSKNSGLRNLTIRRLSEIGNKLYAGTNDGVYVYNETLKKWELLYGERTLQVNGITEAEGDLYIGTNQGVFKSEKKLNDWRHVLPDYALHNISAFDNVIYAMTYNELLSSTDKGITWQSIQKGLPKDLYTFNVLKNDNSVFAAQWDGVYRKEIVTEDWKSSSKGLPEKFAATNFKSYNGILIISCSERKLTTGVTTEK